MRSALKFLVPALATSLTLAACGSSSGSSKSSAEAATPATNAASSSESTATVKRASNAALGATVLVNSQGMTLYQLSVEQGGKFICTSSACTQVWHPLAVSSGTPSGSVGSLGTVKRPDGTMQVTYKGMPLYTFAQDQTAGEAKGQGLKDVGTWTVVKVSASSAPASTTPATTPAESSAPSSSGSGSKYGY
jgi:predicted lipoprotein with Yx(FWY)xxD motif